jgi:predicted lipid carrier protein YhbT
MATQDECAAALERITGSLAEHARQSHSDLDRTLSCHVTDLGVTFSGRLRAGQVESMTTDPAPQAQIRFTMASDDLVELAEGRLAAPAAMASGRLKIQASFMDLLKLRSLL